MKSIEELLFWVGFGFASLVSKASPGSSDTIQVRIAVIPTKNAKELPQSSWRKRYGEISALPGFAFIKTTWFSDFKQGSGNDAFRFLESSSC